MSGGELAHSESEITCRKTIIYPHDDVPKSTDDVYIDHHASCFDASFIISHMPHPSFTVFRLET